MLEKVFRVIFTLLGMLFGYGVSTSLFSYNETLSHMVSASEQSVIVICSAFFFGIIFYYFYSTLSRRGEKAAKSLISDMEKVPIGDLIGGTIGLVAGLVIAFLLSRIINDIKAEWFTSLYLNTIISVVLYVAFGYVGITLGKKGVNEGRILIQQGIPARETARRKGKSQGHGPKILDTSVIIDGRIIDILKTKFLEGDIVIPDFVLVELRHIADSSDALKRNRGRRGLDVLNKIQTDYGIEIYDTKSDKSLDEIPEVDVKLLKLAQSMRGMVVTNDYNLNKVASIQGVGVLNINELANALKPVVLPGETLTVFLVKEGKENSQGVAYLDDGTMIVVEGGKNLIGKTVDTTVTSVLQTSAGRLIFAKPN